MERYTDGSPYLCIRMRFKNPEGNDIVATFTGKAWQEGLSPEGTMLWHETHFEAAARAYGEISQIAMNMEADGKNDE